MGRFPELKTAPSERKEAARNVAERDPVWLDKFFKSVSGSIA